MKARGIHTAEYGKQSLLRHPEACQKVARHAAVGGYHRIGGLPVQPEVGNIAPGQTLIPARTHQGETEAPLEQRPQDKALSSVAVYHIGPEPAQQIFHAAHKGGQSMRRHVIQRQFFAFHFHAAGLSQRFCFRKTDHS